MQLEEDIDTPLDGRAVDRVAITLRLDEGKDGGDDMALDRIPNDMLDEQDATNRDAKGLPFTVCKYRVLS